MSVTHQLITPDGVTFNLNGSGTGWGHATSPGIPGGVGLPPVRHITQEVYGQPGATLRGVDVRPRTIDLPLAAWGDDVEHLMEARAALWGHLRYNRDDGDPPAPAKYRITVDGTAADLKCYFAGDISRAVAGTDKMQLIGIRLIAFDPLWYETTENELRLDHADTLAVKYIAGKVDGQWSALGPPSSGSTVFAIAVHPTTGDVYIGGGFLNWDGNANADYIVYWDVSASAWVALSTGLNGDVYTLEFGPDETLYIGGAFTNAGGDANADYLCQWNGTAFSAVGGVATAGNNPVWDLALAPNSDIYIVGTFTNWATIATADYVAMWDASAGAWVTVGDPAAGATITNIYAIAIGPNGVVYVSGSFLNFAGVADADYIAQWDGASWSEVGGPANGIIRDVLVASDGTLYACGLLTTIDGLTVGYIAQWNGASWAVLGTGLDAHGYKLAEDSKGMIYVSGSFVQAGDIVCDRLAKWNGYTWAHVDIDLPGTPTARAITLSGSDDIYLGFTTVGDAKVAGVTTVTNAGSVDSYPILKVVNVGTLRTIVNETTGEELLFDLYVNEGETITLDLSPDAKAVESDWRGDLLHEVLPNSDLNTFHLASAPVAGSGQNKVSCFITGGDNARETGDNNNQLSGWDGITGLTLANTDDGRLYVKITVLLPPSCVVMLYKDAGRTQQVGHTDNVAAGTREIYEDNSSGLGGTIEIDAVVGTDTDIEVLYTLALIYWYDRWMSLDEAVT